MKSKMCDENCKCIFCVAERIISPENQLLALKIVSKVFEKTDLSIANTVLMFCCICDDFLYVCRYGEYPQPDSHYTLSRTIKHKNYINMCDRTGINLKIGSELNYKCCYVYQCMYPLSKLNYEQLKRFDNVIKLEESIEATIETNRKIKKNERKIELSENLCWMHDRMKEKEKKTINK
jgi:hypothetical protein